MRRMKRMVVEAAVCLLLVGLAMELLKPTACACTQPRGPATFEASTLVHASRGGSVGLVTVTAGGGQVRTNPTTGEAETSIRVAATSWVGTVPTTLWVNEDHISSSGLSLEAFRPGTQWVVTVKNADAGMRSYPLPVVGDTVRLPWKQLVGDGVDGPKPEVMNLDVLRGMARRQQS